MNEPRTNPSTRRLGLVDLLWMVAAAAVGLAYDIQFVIPGWDRLRPADLIDDIRSRGFSAPYHLFYWVQLATPFLLAAHLALIPIRLRPPCPKWRRTLRQPGAVGCLALGSALVATGTLWVLLSIPGWLGYVIVSRSLGGFRYPLNTHVANFLVVAIGHAILGAWVLLAASGRWRSEPSWVDRGGRFLGGCWVVLLPIHYWAAIINP